MPHFSGIPFVQVCTVVLWWSGYLGLGLVLMACLSNAVVGLPSNTVVGMPVSMPVSRR